YAGRVSGRDFGASVRTRLFADPQARRVAVTCQVLPPAAIVPQSTNARVETAAEAVPAMTAAAAAAPVHAPIRRQPRARIEPPRTRATVGGNQPLAWCDS